jgi:hypothetical protein
MDESSRTGFKFDAPYQRGFAMPDTSDWLTVHDVARAMGLALTDRQAWRAGDLIRRAWEYEHKDPPTKNNRTKKAGTGSHCFALYPPEWQPRIERFILSVHAKAAAAQAEEQASLF